MDEGVQTPAEILERSLHPQLLVGVVEAIEDGTSPDEIAALYRLNACSGPLEVALIARGIAYRVAGASFFNRPVIRAALGYLACALDEEDANGWRFGSRRFPKSGMSLCYAAPLRGLGGRFARQYATIRDVRNASSRDLGRWRRGAADLLRTVDEVQSRLAESGLGDALSYLFEDAGLREFYRDNGARADDETETDIADLAAAGFEADTEVAFQFLFLRQGLERFEIVARDVLAGF